MPLVTVNIPERLGVTLLALLERMTVALERIAGPEIVYKPSGPVTLRDYSHVTPEAAAAAQQAEADFAQAHMTVPGSPAYLAAVEEFEAQVRAYGGEEAVEALPWKLPTGNPPA